MVISSHNGFRVLFGKIASYILFEKYIWKWPAEKTGTVPIVSTHFRYLLRGSDNSLAMYISNYMYNGTCDDATSWSPPFCDCSFSLRFLKRLK